MSTFAFIKPQNNLWREAKIHKTVAKIVEKVTSLPAEVRKDRMNPELLLMIAIMIEHCIDNKDKREKERIDKKALALQIMQQIFGQMPPNEVQAIANQLEMFVDHGLVVKIPIYKMIPASCWAWLKSKF